MGGEGNVGCWGIFGNGGVVRVSKEEVGKIFLVGVLV